MVLEGIVTTLDEEETVNIAPMGPVVDPDMSHLLLRPYRTSTTYRNLKHRGEAVFHVTDDVELLAHAAVGSIQPVPDTASAEMVRGRVLSSACRWYELRVADLDDRQPRAEIACDVVHQGRIRDFFGLNRAKHAVVEAAILATRIELLPADQILKQYRQLSVLIEKTAGPQERRAFDFLRRYVVAYEARQSGNPPTDDSCQNT